ncbi:HEPN domain-containing protein [Variovorax sp. J2P1-59]|uniref:HEPN domain-containing protein n=1 Tax=Variovorax flavidus TaxID=3053501 RepID=UPI0025774130|nr:HEPN domain-containing protein [Variovorax sp. J2P1-59]MDM0074427.1 HEPN domain-containing protein [Variovorax sp. J2P1-59]
MTPKQSRTIQHALDRLYGTKSWMSMDVETVRRLDFQKILAREFQVRPDNGRMLLTDSGLSHFKSLVSTIDAANLFGARADYSDVWTACKNVLQELIQHDQQPETADEFVQLVREQVQGSIRQRGFVVSMYGVQLTGLDTFEVGRFSLVRPSEKVLEDQGILDRRGSLPTLMDQMGRQQLWFLGTVEGTERVARREFFDHARLTAGLFAILAASSYEGGAEAFRIGAVVSPEEARTPVSVYLSWASGEDGLGFGRQMRKGQDYEVTSSFATESEPVAGYCRLRDILQKKHRTPLEAAVVRAVFWFADAHRDSSEVMRLVKYWSCIEGFFSAGEDITRSVSIGTAAVLTFGPLGMISKDEYLETRARLVALYGKRSRAVHRAMHDHVDSTDLQNLSQWVAWLLLSMAEMTESYTDSKHILAHSFSLDQELDRDSHGNS